MVQNMVLKIGGGLSGSNKGTSKSSISYLEKENKMRDKTMRKNESFFNQFSNEIAPAEAVKKLDSKKRGLKKTEAKFYNIIISPSKKELAELSDEDLKDFAKKVMSEYTNHFNRDVDPNDLVWYAKLEHYRQEKGFKDKKTPALNTTPGRKSGDFKPGDNRHLHILVRRKTEKNQSLSPMVNNRKQTTTKGAVKGKTGFNRIAFSSKIEHLLAMNLIKKNKGYKHKHEDVQAYNFLKTNNFDFEKAEQLGFNKSHLKIFKNEREEALKHKQEQELKSQYSKVILNDVQKDVLEKGKVIRITKHVDFPVIASYKNGLLHLKKDDGTRKTEYEKNKDKQINLRAKKGPKFN